MLDPNTLDSAATVIDAVVSVLPTSAAPWLAITVAALSALAVLLKKLGAAQRRPEPPKLEVVKIQPPEDPPVGQM